MRTLAQSLQDHDRGYLRIVAELWGFDQPTGAAPAAARLLSEAMLAQASEISTTIPASANLASTSAQLKPRALSLLPFSAKARFLLASFL